MDRTILAILLSAYFEDEKRVVLRLKPQIAPYKAAVFPLVSNKEELVKKARSVFNMLKPFFTVSWDERGNIGKRYFAQDEIGTPFCLTIDYTTLEDDTITIRDRDTTRQQRLKIDKVKEYIEKAIIS